MANAMGTLLVFGAIEISIFIFIMTIVCLVLIVYMAGDVRAMRIKMNGENVKPIKAGTIIFACVCVSVFLTVVLGLSAINNMPQTSSNSGSYDFSSVFGQNTNTQGRR